MGISWSDIVLSLLYGAVIYAAYSLGYRRGLHRAEWLRRRKQETLADDLRREGHRWTGEPGRWSVGETTKEGE